MASSLRHLPLQYISLLDLLSPLVRDKRLSPNRALETAGDVYEGHEICHHQRSEEEEEGGAPHALREVVDYACGEVAN